MSNKREPLQENKMGVMPIGRLVINMSLPIMVAMLVQALYNVVDSKFVSDISENALTALSLAFPIQVLMVAVAVGTGVGINALLSRALGEKNQDRVEKVALNGVFLAGVGSILFVLIGLFVSPIFFRSQVHINAITTADDVSEIINSGVIYLTICCCVSFGLFFSITFERLLQSTGRTLYTMYTQGLGAVINIVLDPILIFGWFGLPKMGVAGAAIATVIGQICGMLLGIYFCLKKNPEVPLNFRGFRPNGEVIRDIYIVGVPSIIMQAIGSVMVYGVNQILIPFTTTAATVFGVYFKLQSFIFMPVFGLNNGIVPILAYNYGARKKERIVKTFQVGLIYAVLIMLVGTMAFQMMPEALLQVFNASENMTAIGVPALRIISLSFPAAAFCIVCGSVFQALGSSFLSMIVSIARQMVVLLPAAWLLSLSGQLELVWWSFPIAEVVSLTMSVIFVCWIYRKRIVPLGDQL